jgi:hypothetical protein
MAAPAALMGAIAACARAAATGRLDLLDARCRDSGASDAANRPRDRTSRAASAWACPSSATSWNFTAMRCGLKVTDLVEERPLLFVFH